MESVDTYVRRHEMGEILPQALLEKLSPVAFAKGDTMIREGDPARHLWFFVEGKAKVVRTMENGSSLLIKFYVPFDILGDVELFSFDSYLFDVESMADTVCLRLAKKEIMASPGKNHRLFMYLCGRLGSKLAEFNANAAVNLRYPVENRLAGYLMAVTERGGSGGGDGSESLGEIAELLGTSYRQLGRVVRRFRDLGLVSESRGRIAVTNGKKLAELARDAYA